MAATFQAMGTEVSVMIPDVTSDQEEAWAVQVTVLFEEAEQRFSRFRPDSELSRLQRAYGPTVVSPALFAMLAQCQRYVRATDGLFDPAVGSSLLALGYDRSFAPGVLDTDAVPTHGASARDGLLAVRLDAYRRSVEIPPGVVVDLGGIVKGSTVDAAMRMLPVNSAVDAGGDAYLRGRGPDGHGWSVDVEDPSDPEAIASTFVTTDTAVATSGCSRRRWRVGAETVHHLIDPRTGRSARTDLLQVTVIAARVADAEVFAKCAFILGREAGGRWLAKIPGTAALLIDHSGKHHVVGDRSGELTGSVATLR